MTSETTAPAESAFAEPRDEALAQAYARTGDRAALERLIARRWPAAVRFATRTLGDPAAAEDAAQDACLRLLDGLRGYDASRPFEPWWRTVLANTIRDAARAQKSRRVREEHVGSRLPAAVPPEGERRVEARELDEHVRRLPSDVRVAVVLHFYQGLGHAEVASALGCPLGTASSKLRRGIERLRASMGPALVATALAAVQAEEAAAQALDGAADAARGAAALRGEAPAGAGGTGISGSGSVAAGGVSGAPTIAALEAARTARAAAARAARSLLLRAGAAGLGVAVATVVALVTILPAPPPLEGKSGERAGAVAALSSTEHPGDEASQGVARSGSLGHGGAARASDRSAPPLPPPAPRRDALPAATATATAAAPAAPPTATADPEEDDPLIRRALALLERARGLRDDLRAELADRLVVLPDPRTIRPGKTPRAFSKETVVEGVELSDDLEVLAALPALRQLEAQIEAIPLDRDLAERKARSRFLEALEQDVMRELARLLAAERKFLEREVAAGRPACFTRELAELAEVAPVPDQWPPRAPAYAIRIASADAASVVLEASPLPLEVGAELHLRLEGRPGSFGELRADARPPTAESPLYAQLVAERVAGLPEGPSPSMHAHRLRAFEREAVELVGDLLAATLARIAAAPLELDPYTREALAALSRVYPSPPPGADDRIAAGSQPSDQRAQALEQSLADYRLARRDPAAAATAMVERRKGSNEAAAIGTLRTLTTAQALFREGDKDRNDTLDYAGDLRDLEHAQLIDAVLASGRKQGYRFEIRSGGQFEWSAGADPIAPGRSGDRSFFVDESGVIRFSTSGPAHARSTAIGG